MAGYKGHLRGGIATGIGLIVLAKPLGLLPLNFTGVLELTLGSLIGSLLPDIDHPQSFLGRRLRFISSPLNKYFGHRTITHSIYFLCITLFLPTLLSFPLTGVGLCLGVFSHILLDFLCIGSGVAFFYPTYKRRIHLLHKIKLMNRHKRRKL